MEGADKFLFCWDKNLMTRQDARALARYSTPNKNNNPQQGNPAHQFPP
jgi:hypothetical protein